MPHHDHLNLTDASLLKLNVGYIDGQWVEAISKETFDVLDPATNLKWASCASMDAKDTQRAIDAAEAAFPAYSRIPPRLRAQRLLAYDALLRDAKRDLAQILVLETGKPLAEALGEVECESRFRLVRTRTDACRCAHLYLVDGGRGRTHRRPEHHLWYQPERPLRDQYVALNACRFRRLTLRSQASRRSRCEPVCLELSRALCWACDRALRSRVR
jgi:hypothetical protein